MLCERKTACFITIPASISEAFSASLPLFLSFSFFAWDDGDKIVVKQPVHANTTIQCTIVIIHNIIIQM